MAESNAETIKPRLLDPTPVSDHTAPTALQTVDSEAGIEPLNPMKACINFADDDSDMYAYFLNTSANTQQNMTVSNRSSTDGTDVRPSTSDTTNTTNCAILDSSFEKDQGAGVDAKALCSSTGLISRD